MKIALSTHLYVYKHLDEKIISEIASHGFKNIEIWCGNPHFNYNDIHAVKKLAAVIKKYNLNPVSFHSPIYMNVSDAKKREWLSLADTDEKKRKTSVTEFINACKAMEVIGSGIIVAHIGNTGDPYTEESFDAFLRSIETVLNFAEKKGISIALENTISELSSYKIIEKLLKSYNSGNLAVCLDIAHSKIKGGITAGFDKFGSRIITMHVHDNDGINDQHLVPGIGIINWDKVKRKLASYKHGFVLELRDYGNIPEILLETRKFLKGFINCAG